VLAGIEIKTDLSLGQLEDGTYNSVSKAVGGYIEHITLHGVFEGYSLYINEEGKLLNLPINPVATAIWERVYGRTDFLVGDAVLVSSKTDDEGNELPLSEEQVEKVLELIAEAFSRFTHPTRSKQ
jgi:hypothetical protein